MGNSANIDSARIDLERTAAWKYAGYPAFSSFAASSKDCFAIRRFAALNVRVLLKLQDDIVILERKLRDMDEYTRQLPMGKGGSGSLRLDAGTPRQELLDQIAELVHEYNVRLAAFLSVADRPTAAPEHIANLKNWLANRPNAIEETEQEFLDHETDILSIRTPRRTHFGSWIERLGIWRLAGAAFSSNKSGTTRYYDRNVLKTIGGFFFLVSTLLLLLGPLWALVFIRDEVTKVALVTAFTVVFALLLVVGTTLKAFHRGITTAAYFAIAVLILGFSSFRTSPDTSVLNEPSSTSTVRTTVLTTMVQSVVTVTSVKGSVTTVTAALTPGSTVASNTNSATASPSQASSTSSSGLSVGAIAAISVSIPVGLIAVVISSWIVIRRKRSQPIRNNVPIKSHPSWETQRAIAKLPLGQRQKAKVRISTWEDAIQPHTDECGDAYFIGDAYESVDPALVEEWAIKDGGPYLAYVKEVSKHVPYLEYLAHWMEVTCSPLKWNFVKNFPENRTNRAQRTKACVIDFTQNKLSSVTIYRKSPALLSFLSDDLFKSEKTTARLIIVEDLSRDVVEGLGAYFDIDPRLFRAHISDYLFYNTRDRWYEPHVLDTDRRHSSHFSLSYLRAMYFRTENAFEEAERECGTFNVLRRIDGDRSRKALKSPFLGRSEACVSLSRAKTSVWLKPKHDKGPATAILLVDPTPSSADALWRGYENYRGVPSMSQMNARQFNRGGSSAEGVGDHPGRGNLFDEIVYQSTHVPEEEIELYQSMPCRMVFPMLKLVVEDWFTTLRYMESQLALIRWGLEKPHIRQEDIEQLLKKLSPWSRNIHYYQRMVAESITCLQTTMVDDSPLLSDFRHVAEIMAETKTRLEKIEYEVRSALSLAQRAWSLKVMSSAMYRLIAVLVIFLPTILVSSFLTSAASPTIWLFFAVGIPLAALTAIAEAFLRPGAPKSWLRHWHALFRSSTSRSIEEDRAASRSPGPKRVTGAWPYYRDGGMLAKSGGK